MQTINLLDVEPKKLISELVYTSYAYNRDRSPELSVKSWAHPNVFGEQAWEMEERYQKEKNGKRNPERA